MSDEIYRSMSRAARYAAALKADDKPGLCTVLDEIRADHSELSRSARWPRGWFRSPRTCASSACRSATMSRVVRG
jgi:hypothetical protein